MAHNKALADERGISQQNREYIDQLHLMLEELIETYTLDVDFDKAYELCHDIEYLLQDLWGFSRNKHFHSWAASLKQKWMNLTWTGRTFKCKDTGEVVVIPEEWVYEGSFIKVGDGALDLGRVNSYHRILGDIEEIK